MDATRCYERMAAAIDFESFERAAGDSSSPRAGLTREAWPGGQYHVTSGCLPRVAGACPRWAAASTLHFFAATEQAGMLRRYNVNADKFLVGDMWIGAYGAAAVPQLKECVAHLLHRPHSRRAVVSMGGMMPMDLNRPACWSFLHLLRVRRGLALLVYQRSLNLSIMPYDCCNLMNVLNWACWRLEAESAGLFWTVGSLHCDRPRAELADQPGCLLDPALLDASTACYRELLNPTLEVLK